MNEPHPAYDFLPHLTEELALIEPMLENDPSDASKRLYIRALFAVYEGLSCAIREKAMYAVITNFEITGHLKIQEAALLEDYTYGLSNTGEIESRGRCNIPFARHLAFGIKMLNKYSKSKVDLVHGAGWDAFKRATRIRNRITHPKTEEDVAISDEDFEYVVASSRWVFNSILTVVTNETEQKG